MIELMKESLFALGFTVFALLMGALATVIFVGILGLLSGIVMMLAQAFH